MRLIDADAMKEELLWGNVYLSDNETNALVDLIDNQPTIDPESLRPRGHWERPSKVLNIVTCTACKTTFPGDFDEFRYCPNCGCFMENKNGGSYVKK